MMSAPTALTFYHESIRAFLEWQLQRDSLASFFPDQFLDLRVTAVDPDDDPLGESSIFAGNSPIQNDTRFSVRALALLKKPNRRILLTGISGAGKTVALGSLAQRLTATALAALKEGADPELMPLWTPTSDLLEVDFSKPVDWLAGRLQDGGVYSQSERLAEFLLSNGCLVLLLDSLHEVVGISPARTRTLSRLAALPGVRIVASARPGYELPGAERDCDVLLLEGLNPAERSRILTARNLSLAERDQLYRLVIEPRLQRAVEVPQIWQMAIALATGGVDLTNINHVATLYERFCEETLSARGPVTLSLYPAGEVEALVEVLAAASAFHGCQDVSLNDATDLVEHWASCYGRSRHLLYPHDWAKHFVDRLPRFYHPVLRMGGRERAIGFAHGSLAEFLAARWVLKLWRMVPPEFLPIPELADLISFAAEIQELSGVDSFIIRELDAAQVRRGSFPLLLSWLRRTPKERIETIKGEVQLRFWHAPPNEARQLLMALGARGGSFGEQVMGSLLSSLGDEQAKRLRKIIQKGERKNLIAGESEPPKGRTRKRGARKKAQNLFAKDMPVLSELMPPLEDLRTRLKSEDANTRAMAARLIGLSSRPATALELIPFLERSREESAEVRGRVATALGRLGNLDAVPNLIESLERRKEPAAIVRGRAARSLGFLRSPQAIGPLARCLEPKVEPDCVVRGAAITALGRLGNTGVVDALIMCLDPRIEPDPINRVAAASSLGLLGDARAVDTLLLRLDQRQESDPRVRGSAATALGALGDAHAVDTLLLRLGPTQESEPMVRGSAATALGALGDIRAVNSLLQCLDPDREPRGNVRGSAATALGLLGDIRAIDPLLQCLDPDREPRGNVRGSAATALGLLGDVRGVNALVQCLDPDREPRGDVRGSAATALGLLGDVRAVDSLLQCLDPDREPKGAVRGSATTALGLLGDFRAVETLLLCLLDPHREPEVVNRAAAATALGVLGDNHAIGPLRLCLDPEQELNPTVRRAAAAALRRFDRKDSDSIQARTISAGTGAREDVKKENEVLEALDDLWRKLLEDFFLWTETPLEGSFSRELERCLLAMERYLGGSDSRGWVEKDYERVLAALLAKDRGGVVTEAEPADRERTDILVQLSDGSQSVLELKFDDPKRLVEQLAQLRQYLASFKSDDRQTEGHLILLDRNPLPAWNEKQRRTEQEGVSVWRVHVNRQPASKRSRAVGPSGPGSRHR